MVPALGLAAHGVASGMIPTPPAIALCLVVGVVIGVVVDVVTRLGRGGWPLLIGILSIAQGAAHVALCVGHDHHAGSMAGSGPTAGGMSSGHEMPAGGGVIAHHLHTLLAPWSADGAAMVLTHLVAVPVTALLIALAAAVTGVATSVVAALRDPGPRLRPPRTPALLLPTVVACPRIDRAAGPGDRGPPRLLASI